MAPKNSKYPNRSRREDQELANGKGFLVPRLPVYPHQAHPPQEQQSNQGDPVGQRHEKPVELVPFMHAGDPVSTIFTVHRDLLRIFFTKNIQPVTPKSSAVLPMERKANQVKILISVSSIA